MISMSQKGDFPGKHDIDSLVQELQHQYSPNPVWFKKYIYKK